MVRMGYLVPEWPTQTHAFFWRELSALRALGDEVVLLSTRRPNPKACRHLFAEEAHATTSYLFPPRLRAQAQLTGESVRWSTALDYVRDLRESSALQRAKVLALIPSALELAALVREQGLEHIHVHSCADAAHLVAICHRLCGVPYSLALHGDLPVYGVDHASKMADAAFVVAVTRPLQEQLATQVGLPAARAPVISMGVDTRVFEPVERPFFAGRLKLVTVARLHPNKGHLQALEAIKRARDEGLDVTYAIAGEGPFRAGIEAKVEELGLSSVVRMCGGIGEEQVRALLAESDAFVLASVGVGEAAPVSVMEAMASGMAVVCSKIGGTPDMIQDGVDGLLVEQNDVSGLLSAFRRLANDGELRACLGYAARQKACAAFDHRHCAKLLRAAIRGQAIEVRREGLGVAGGRGPAFERESFV